MVDENLVGKINKELRALKAEAITHKENERLIRVMDALVRLTNIGDVEDDAPEASDPEAHSSPQVQTGPEECQHFFNVYGRCNRCGFCTHQTVRGGTCIVCDATIPAESV